MLKTVYDANVAIENYDFKKLVEVENQTIQILTIKFAGKDESGFKYWGLCKYPEDIENKSLFRLMFPVAFNRLVNEAINKKQVNIDKVNENVVFKSAISSNGSTYWSYEFI